MIDDRRGPLAAPPTEGVELNGREAHGLSSRGRGPIGEVERRLPALSLVCRLLAELADRAIPILAVGHPDDRPAPFALDDHRRAGPPAGEHGARSGGIDPE